MNHWGSYTGKLEVEKPLQPEVRSARREAGDCVLNDLRCAELRIPKPSEETWPVTGSTVRRKNAMALWTRSLQVNTASMLGQREVRQACSQQASLNGAECKFSFIFLLSWNIKCNQKITQKQNTRSQSKDLVARTWVRKITLPLPEDPCLPHKGTIIWLWWKLLPYSPVPTAWDSLVLPVLILYLNESTWYIFFGVQLAMFSCRPHLFIPA